MFKVEALIQPDKLDEVCAAVAPFDIPRVIVTDVRDHGSAGMIKSTYRGGEWSAAVRWVKVEMLVSSLRVDEAVEALRNAARTEFRADDGTLIVSEVADAIRIRDGERVRSTWS